HVPALRERKDDIGLLAEHILERLVRTHGRPPVQLAPDALALLQSYAFPGNVRELENVLERALTLAEDNVIRMPDIHLRRNPEPVTAAQAAAPPAVGPEDVPEHTDERTAPLGEQLGEIEKEAIRKALEQTRYNKTAAAKLLGMSFRQLRYRIKKLGLD
ncbi:MAG: sigma-54-dependent Fis family transcriptional regulator, partial [Gammaproteobacteria bacterium]|nr:sigma-54-dependent Fis family transcriptional regulator [Gammaproteobacteria bacterium]